MGEGAGWHLCRRRPVGVLTSSVPSDAAIPSSVVLRSRRGGEDGSHLEGVGQMGDSTHRCTVCDAAIYDEPHNDSALHPTFRIFFRFVWRLLQVSGAAPYGGERAAKVVATGMGCQDELRTQPQRSPGQGEDSWIRANCASSLVPVDLGCSPTTLSLRARAMTIAERCDT
jgi:hypothetical protein